jgi:hypothetical protein
MAIAQEMRDLNRIPKRTERIRFGWSTMERKPQGRRGRKGEKRSGSLEKDGKNPSLPWRPRALAVSLFCAMTT